MLFNFYHKNYITVQLVKSCETCTICASLNHVAMSCYTKFQLVITSVVRDVSQTA